MLGFCTARTCTFLLRAGTVYGYHHWFDTAPSPPVHRLPRSGTIVCSLPDSARKASPHALNHLPAFCCCRHGFLRYARRTATTACRRLLLLPFPRSTNHRDHLLFAPAGFFTVSVYCCHRMVFLLVYLPGFFLPFHRLFASGSLCTPYRVIGYGSPPCRFCYWDFHCYCHACAYRSTPPAFAHDILPTRHMPFSLHTCAHLYFAPFLFAHTHTFAHHFCIVLYLAFTFLFLHLCILGHLHFLSFCTFWEQPNHQCVLTLLSSFLLLFLLTTQTFCRFLSYILSVMCMLCLTYINASELHLPRHLYISPYIYS